MDNQGNVTSEDILAMGVQGWMTPKKLQFQVKGWKAQLATSIQTFLLSHHTICILGYK